MTRDELCDVLSSAFEQTGDIPEAFGEFLIEVLVELSTYPYADDQIVVAVQKVLATRLVEEAFG